MGTTATGLLASRVVLLLVLVGEMSYASLRAGCSAAFRSSSCSLRFWAGCTSAS